MERNNELQENNVDRRENDHFLNQVASGMESLLNTADLPIWTGLLMDSCQSAEGENQERHLPPIAVIHAPPTSNKVARPTAAPTESKKVMSWKKRARGNMRSNEECLGDLVLVGTSKRKGNGEELGPSPKKTKLSDGLSIDTMNCTSISVEAKIQPRLDP